MSTAEISLFLGGLICCGYAVVGLFFLRFWRQTRDRLFICFAAAFWLLAIERALLVWFFQSHLPGIYLVRLAAFILIVLAIVGKNREGRTGA